MPAWRRCPDPCEARSSARGEAGRAWDPSVTPRPPTRIHAAAAAAAFMAFRLSDSGHGTYQSIKDHLLSNPKDNSHSVKPTAAVVMAFRLGAWEARQSIQPCSVPIRPPADVMGFGLGSCLGPSYLDLHYSPLPLSFSFFFFFCSLLVVSVPACYLFLT